ncbi:cobalamin-binding protein [Acetobacterium fimetarium]|uniref:Cobalamin-binding protein n=1 Tax=Acetobacterium fimetarium TaxID=52691 RepID=A0ABR6WQI4_9FIRM|nr:cobalamin-dependent protein [Acetobacterium fimetarium]MBC3802835.1 cobalamin-binding protein [Acetobacterium fimetarium]
MEELLIQAVKDVNEKDILMLVDQAFATGYTPEQIIEILKRGMDCVGKEYEIGNYFIADLMMSGIIFKEILSQERMQPTSSKDDQNAQDTILVGTVKGDLHDIGKGLFSGMALSCGYHIVDLGVDVSPQAFVDQIKELKPQILALSGVLHTAIKSMKDTVDLIEKNGLRDQIKIIVGGNPLTLETFHFIGADAYSRDAAEGIKIIQNWIKEQE